MLIILVKLIVAHLVGDFLLQPDRLCNLKYSKSIVKRNQALVIHSLIQAVLVYIFLGLWDNWYVPMIIGVSHFVIDWIKVASRKNNLPAFIVDQVAHYMVILLVWHFMNNEHSNTPDSSYCLVLTDIWIVVTSYIAILAPTSILIRLFIDYEKWMPSVGATQGLPNAGKWIGYLERILILTFIYTDNVEGIGFLLAAKSVFRFGELNRAKDIKVTEYVLIGTFSSFAIAILIGFSVHKLIHEGGIQ